MRDLVITPKDGSRYIEDVSIDTKSWLKDRFGKSASVDIEEVEDAYGNIEDIWPKSEAVRKAIEKREGREYIIVASDNVYNHENDFSDIFVYAIYAPDNSESIRQRDWLYEDDVYVAISLHRGGDARGNYGGVTVYKSDQIGEGHFFDWNVGWYVTTPDGEPVESSDRYQIGYAQKPTSELERALDDEGDEFFEWRDGAFHATMDGEPIIATPYVDIDNLG